MKNYLQPGKLIPVDAGATKSSGTLVRVGGIVGVAVKNMVSGTEENVQRGNVFSLPKSSDSFSQGDYVYFNFTANQATATVSDFLIGVAKDAAASGGTTVNTALFESVLPPSITGNTATPSIATTDTTTAAGAVSLDTYSTAIDSTVGAIALTLADGEEGQKKFLYMTVDGGDATLTPAHLGNGTTLTFDDVGDCAELEFHGARWYYTGGTATLA